LEDKKISRGRLSLTNKGGEKGITIFSNTLYPDCYSEVMVKKYLEILKRRKNYVKEN